MQFPNMLLASDHSYAISSTRNSVPLVSSYISSRPQIQIPSSVQPVPFLGGTLTPYSALPSQRLPAICPPLLQGILRASSPCPLTWLDQDLQVLLLKMQDFPLKLLVLGSVGRHPAGTKSQ